jgi:hypothetical protein
VSAEEHDASTCSRNFKAASGSDSSDQVVDSGLVAAVCRCGVPLRVYNVRRTGERLAYVCCLLRDILKDPDCPPTVYTMYDINCVFSKYSEVNCKVKKKLTFQKALKPEDYSRLKFAIGIYFHLVERFYFANIRYRNLSCLCPRIFLPSTVLSIND